MNKETGPQLLLTMSGIDRKSTADKRFPIVEFGTEIIEISQSRLCWQNPEEQKATKLKQLNSVAFSPHSNYIPTERPPLVGEVSFNFCG
jgi:hypothetical protein